MLLISAELVLGVVVLLLAVRQGGVPRILGWLSRAHTGSINDYAAFATVGMIALACALLL
jgi:multicomponent Na+:H+ antiporter subunit D